MPVFCLRLISIIHFLIGGDATTYPFYEGWQNTLHIIINPTAITFTADVAEWADIDAQEYEIEQGNVNP